MKDIQKIKEFFSKPVEESLTGGYPHKKTSGEDFEKIEITEPIDDATKNKMIKNFRAAGWDAKPNNGGGITAIKKAMIEALEEADINDPVLMKARAAAFQRTQPKPELPKPVKTINPDYKAIKNADKIKALKMRRAQLMSDMEQEAEPEGGPIANRYGRELNKIDQAISMLSEGNKEYFKPSIRKDKSNPNFLYIDIAYPAGSGVLSIGGSKTMGGQDRESGAAKALSMGNAIVKKLQSKYNIEDIEVKDLKNGKVEVFAVSDDFIKMASPSLDESKSNPEVDKLLKIINTKKGGPEYKKALMDLIAMAEKKSGKTINTKKEALLALDYIEPTISEVEEEEETAVDMAKKQLDALGIKYEMSGNKFKPFRAIYKPSNEDLDALYDQEYELTRIYQNDKSEENWKKLSQIREKGKRLEKFDEIIYLFNLGSAVKPPVNEATKDEETKFHKKLDTLVHSTFGKRKSELEEVNLKQAKLSSAEYQKAKKLKDFKSSDWKWNANEDLYIKVVKEATDYMKRRKSEDDYATSKEDKPKKSTNPNPSGKTDYMKRRQKELTETILAKLKR